MGTSPILVAPGVRSPASPGWRTAVATAADIVWHEPRLWLYGSLAFLLRGGVAVLTLPIIALPTQVEMRAIVGGHLGSTGFTSGFWDLVTVAAIATTAALLAIAGGIARLEIASFERVAGRLGSQRERRAAHLQVFAVQLLAVIGLTIAVIPLALGIGEAAYDEVLRPSSTGSIYGRVLERVTQPLLLAVAGIVVVDLFCALASREVLVRAIRQPGTGRVLSGVARSVARAFVRPFRFPERTLATAALGWLLTGAAVVVATWVIRLSWQSVRGSFLTSAAFTELGADMGADLEMLVVATGLASAFIAGIVATGFASAVRGAAWSVDRLSHADGVARP